MARDGSGRQEFQECIVPELPQHCQGWGGAGPPPLGAPSPLPCWSCSRGVKCTQLQPLAALNIFPALHLPGILPLRRQRWCDYMGNAFLNKSILIGTSTCLGLQKTPNTAQPRGGFPPRSPQHLQSFASFNWYESNNLTLPFYWTRGLWLFPRSWDSLETEMTNILGHFPGKWETFFHFSSLAHSFFGGNFQQTEGKKGEETKASGWLEMAAWFSWLHFLLAAFLGAGATSRLHPRLHCLAFICFL